MTAREEVAKALHDAATRIQAVDPGSAPKTGWDPDMHQVRIDETHAAVVEALYAIADRVDRLESNSTKLS